MKITTESVSLLIENHELKCSYRICSSKPNQKTATSQRSVIHGFRIMCIVERDASSFQFLGRLAWLYYIIVLTIGLAGFLARTAGGDKGMHCSVLLIKFAQIQSKFVIINVCPDQQRKS